MATEKRKLCNKHCAKIREARLRVQKLQHETAKLLEPATKLRRKAKCDHGGLPKSIVHDFLGKGRMRKCTVPEVITTNLRYLLRETGFVQGTEKYSKISHNGLLVHTLKGLPKLQELKGMLDINNNHLVELCDSLEECIEAFLSCKMKEFGVQSGICNWRVGVLKSVDNDPQGAHCGFMPESVDQRSLNQGSRNKHIDSSFKESVPYLFAFPLYAEGLKMEVWPDHAWEVVRNGMKAKKVQGSIISLSLGDGLLVRGDVIHAGGFISGFKNGNLRCHIYIYLNGGMPMEPGLMTHYNFGSVAFSEYCVSSCPIRRELHMTYAQSCSKNQGKQMDSD